jgi:hypothetical protein
MVPKVRAKK